MDAEEPHVENENEQDSENGIDDNEINSATEQDTREEHINSNEHRNIDNMSVEASDIVPNIDDQPMPIIVEGAPNYPVLSPRNEIDEPEDDDEQNAENEINAEGEPNDRNNRRRVVILYENRVELVDAESNSDENVSDAEEVENESAIGMSSSSIEDSENEDEDAEERETFDTELPAQHQYMGESREVGGRIILEENNYVEIPVISQPGIILMPGQTLPMTFFQPAVISMMKGLVETTKTFGILHKRYRSSQPGLIEEANVGTTAEIYECREPSSGTEVGYHIKAKGRQRFKVISMRRQIDGNRIATVDILREKVLPDPLYEIRLISRDRLRPFSPDPIIPEELAKYTLDSDDEAQEGSSEGVSHEPKAKRATPEPSSTGIKESLTSLLSRLTSSNSEKKIRERENKEEFLPKPVSFKLTRQNNLRTAVYAPPITPYPNWVYEMYNPDCLVERIHEALSHFKLFSQTQVAIPTHPQELSFWVATNLPLDDTHRMALLKLDCTIQRLRCELSLLEMSNILCCRNCGETLAQQSDIFSMCKEGPQGSYVNPGGYVHETLTLYKVKNILYTGQPSTEYSWFPGYAWQICQCSYCDSHLGWRFTASSSKKLHPKKFYGISRRSIRPKLELEDSASSKTQGAENNKSKIPVI